MAYIPKSKIKKGKSTGDYLVKGKNTPYHGPIIITSEGKAYAGNNSSLLGPELIKNPELFDKIIKELPYTKRFNNQSKSKNYNKRNRKTHTHLRNKLSISPSKPRPKELDYIRGYYLRFFAKRINGNSCIEINAQTYNSLLSKDKIYDYNLYEIGALKWHIMGNDIHKKNSESIKRVSFKFPYIFNTFPLLNEFARHTTLIQENLYTHGGELYYSDGTEYIGGYHIHPVQGPMVGDTHSPDPHDKLYYFNQLPQYSGQSYEDSLANYSKIECFRCININGTPNIVSNLRSRILGCLPRTFTTYEEASNNCPSIDYTQIDFNPDTDQITYSNYRPITLNPIGGGEVITGNDVIDNSSGRPGENVLQVYSCFVPNTLITMADGTEKTISSIKKGDKVKSENGESNVLDIKIHEGDFEVYSLNDNKPFVTAEHPFKTIDGWKAIDPITTYEKHQIRSTTLDLNDIVIKLDGSELVNKIEKGPVKYPKVYNLALDNEHVYYANGYLVHNEKNMGVLYN